MYEGTAFAEFLDRAINNSGMSLGEIADALQKRGYAVNKSTLWRWQHGETRPAWNKLGALQYLPDILGISTADLPVYNRLLHRLVGRRPVSHSDNQPEHRTHFLKGQLVYFVGREQELKQLETAVSRRQPVLITGLGGIGKTSLARRLVEKMARRFAHGCDALHLSQHYSDADVVSVLARRLGAPFSIEAPGQDVRLLVEELGHWAYGIDMLLLLDDVASAAQVELIIAGLPTITWIITSRRKLFFPAFDMYRLELSLPPPSTAARMLCAFGGVQVTQEHLSEAQRIGERLGYLPIALRTAAGLVVTERVVSLSGLYNWLVEQGIAALQIEQWDITLFFEQLLLMIQPPEVREIFDLCGVFALPHLRYASLQAIAHALKLPIEQYDRLADLSLVLPDGEMVELHPLIHEYAVSRLAQNKNRQKIVEQFTVYFAKYAEQHRGKHDALREEWENLLVAAQYAYESGSWTSLKPFWGPITGHLWMRSEWQRYREFHEKCLELIRLEGDKVAEANSLAEIAWVYLEEEKWETAEPLFHQIKLTYDELNMSREAIRIGRQLGVLYLEWGKLAKATQFLQEAELMLGTLTASDKLDKWIDIQLSLVRHAQACVSQAYKEYDRAHAQSMEAIEIYQRSGETSLIPTMRLKLGDILWQRAKSVEAIKIWRDIALYGEQYRPEMRLIAGAKLRLAQVEAHQGHGKRALQWAYEARHIYARGGLANKVRRVDDLITRINLLRDAKEWSEIELWD